ncbi:Bifunctional dehydrogenase and ferrochelatase [Myotisia sp. PD_48]|nr:Bifunctional dehydrogenase and ferrochelatase [Myotisia sp. PD_48]
MSSKFPAIQPGGSLLVAWQVAAGRIVHALNADAKVTVVCPRSCLNEEVAYRVSQEQVNHVDSKFEPSHLNGVDMVFAAIDDPVASTQIWKLCKERRIPANIADVPPECDFYFGSVHRDGPLQVMVSTNGNGPKLASMVRKDIAAALPQNTGAVITNVGILRKKLRQKAPSADEGSKRMKWISRVCEAWSFDDLEKMSKEDMDTLLGYYTAGTVPTFEQVQSR